MLSFYKFLSPVLIPDDSKIYVVFGIPILPMHSKFNIFKAVSMSFQDPITNLSAEYILESSYLAFSKPLGQYGFISNSEIDSCERTPVCKIRSPLYDTAHYPSCMLSLYLKIPDKIQKMCNKRIVARYPLPEIKYLSFGKWAITTPTAIPVQIHCYSPEAKSRTITTNPGLNILELEPGCGATSKFFVIPIYETGSYNVEAKLQIENEIKLNKISLDSWQQTSKLFERLRFLDNLVNQSDFHLKDISDLPVEKLELLLHSQKFPKTHVETTVRTFKTPLWLKIAFGFSVFCTITLFAYLALRFFVFKRLRQAILKPRKAKYHVTFAQDPASTSLEEVKLDPVQSKNTLPPASQSSTDWRANFKGTKPVDA